MCCTKGQYNAIKVNTFFTRKYHNLFNFNCNLQTLATCPYRSESLLYPLYPP